MALETATPHRAKGGRSGITWVDDRGGAGRRSPSNVARAERVGSVAVGCALVTYGIRRRDPVGVVAAMLGGMFVLRGATGRCPIYRALGVSTGSADAVLGRPRSDVAGRAATVNARKALRVERVVTIQADRHALYEFWRDLENLPRFMKHLVSVQLESSAGSHWVARGPMGMTVEWDAEIVNDIPDTLLAWKSVSGAMVPNAGSVHFTDALGGRGTIVRVVMEVESPAGKLGFAMARLFGENPERELGEDLLRFKEMMETGED